MAYETFFTETKLTVDGEKINARISWNNDDREWLVEVLANGMALVEYTDTVAKLNNACLSADDMVNEYIQRVFKERQNDAQSTEPAAPEPTPAQPNVFYTDPVVTADGDEIIGRVTRRGEHDFLIEVLARGVVDTGLSEIGSTFAYAMLRANEIVAAYTFKVNDPFKRRPHLRMKPVATISLKTGKVTETESPRIRQLREKIARNERELESLRFELAQALDE